MKSAHAFPFSLLFLLFITTACLDKDPVVVDPDTTRSDVFESVPLRVPIAPGQVDEASGLADSRTLPGYLWTHEDAGSDNRLFLLNHEGTSISSYVLPGIVNYDWEDIAVGGGPQEGVSYLYIGDIGNNDANPGVTSHSIYRMPELTSLEGSFSADQIARVTYRYPEGTPDAETLLFDSVTKDLFVISKELERTRIYRLPYPQSTDGVVTAELVGQIPAVLLATGGDISADGQEILIRTYTNVYYWRRKSGETIGQALLRQASKTLPYELEPQGEAVCFDREMKGYFTLSERRTATSVTLNYYGRK
ncbi:PE-PGRS family protein [Salmonirosea aquatica]